MARVPAHPRLARALVEAARLGCAERVARIAAALSDRDPAESVPANALLDLLDEGDPRSDALAREKLLARAQRREFHAAADRMACREAVLVVEQLTRSLERVPSRTAQNTTNEALDRALIAGFPDRIAFKLEISRPHCALAGRRRVELAKESLVHDAGFLIALEVRESGPDHDRLVSIPVAHPVPRKLVEDALPDAFTTRSVAGWNVESRAVETAEETLFHGAIVERRARPAKSSPQVDAELVARIKSGEIKPTGWEEHCEPWIARVRCVAEWFPERGLITYADDELDVVRAELCSGCVRAREVEAKPAIDAVRGVLSWDDVQFVEKMAPAAIRMPRGFNMKVEYEPGKPPRGRAKIQDFYGLEETPKVANGRVSLVVEILGPNYRPLQVTQDLVNFWRVLYPEMRNELRRRYPRHEWR